MSSDVVDPPTSGGSAAVDLGSSRLGTAAASVISLLFLAVGLVGWGVGSTPAKDAGMLLFALFGFGTAWLLVLGASRLPVLSLGAPVGLTFVILVGFVLVETRTWQAGVPIFVVAVVGASVVHAGALLRWVAQARLDGVEPEVPAAAAPEVSTGPEVITGPEVSNAPAGSGASAVGAAGSGGLSRWGAGQLRFAVVAGLSVIGLLACLVSATAANNLDPSGPSGLFGALSPVWYVGMALVVAAVLVGLRLDRVSSSAPGRLQAAAMALPVVVLSLAVTLTPALVYTEPRYSWTAKHLGVTSYILLHGSINPTIDIYQAWPGLFAGVAWVCHGIGIHGPTPIARWWPPVIDLATLIAFQRLSMRVIGNVRRSWWAVVILLVSNTIGQDYFSPQAAGYLLAIGIFALVYRRPEETRGFTVPEWGIFLAVSVGLAVTHQLTPYMVFGALVVLLVFGQLRSALLPVPVLLTAVGWALLHLSVVRRYFSLSQFGRVGSNVLTQGLADHAVHRAILIRLDSYSVALDALIVGAIALISLFQRRSRTHWALAVCAASGAGLFLANSYGNEGVFRVLLFAVPWLALLVADWEYAKLKVLRWIPAVSIPVLLALYLFSDMGLDYINAVRTGDLGAERAFEDSAPRDSTLLIMGDSYTPIRSTGTYNLYHFTYYPFIRPPLTPSKPNDATLSYTQFMTRYIAGAMQGQTVRTYYALFAQQPSANLSEQGLSTVSQYRAFDGVFDRGKNWVVVKKTKTARLYVLRSFFFNTVRPVIRGPLVQGHELLAGRGSWPSITKLTYRFQWESCTSSSRCTDIPGADKAILRLTRAEIGKGVKVAVTATDTTGASHVVTSATSAAVRRAPVKRSLSEAQRNPVKKKTRRAAQKA